VIPIKLGDIPAEGEYVAELVRSLQERAARAAPAQHTRDEGGWLLRHAPGCGWWMGTVLAHAQVSATGLTRAIEVAEDFYAGHGVTASFQITPGVGPAGLDLVLAERGYRRSASISLQVALAGDVRAAAPDSGPRVEVSDRPSPGWLASRGDSPAEQEMLRRVRQPSVYACATIGGEIVAVGRGVADSGWTGVFGLATLPQARGKGAASRILATLAGTFQTSRLYLQVERDNTTALRLYERMGFSELAVFHYRTAETPSGKRRAR
jgi:hypothetical protein